MVCLPRHTPGCGELGGTLVIVLAVIFCLAIPAWTAQAQVFKWVDENGTIHFSNTPPENRTADDVEVRQLDGHRPIVRGQAGVDAEEGGEDSEPKHRREVPKDEFIELFTAQWCAICRRARAFLDNEGLPYVEYDIEADASAARRVRDLTGGSAAVPVALIGKKLLRGFSPASYGQAIDLWLGD